MTISPTLGHLHPHTDKRLCCCQPFNVTKGFEQIHSSHQIDQHMIGRNLCIFLIYLLLLHDFYTFLNFILLFGGLCELSNLLLELLDVSAVRYVLMHFGVEVAYVPTKSLHRTTALRCQL